METRRKRALNGGVPCSAVTSSRSARAALVCVALCCVVIGIGPQLTASAALVEDTHRSTQSPSVDLGSTNAAHTVIAIAPNASQLDASARVRASTDQVLHPPLPAPSGAVIKVSTEPQLQSAVRNLRSDTTIVIAPGTYVLTSTLSFAGSVKNVGIRGATNNRDDVVLVGPGMTKGNEANAPSGIWTGNGVQGVTIANLAIRDFPQHPIVFNAGTQSPFVHNVHLINAGKQFIKSNPDGAGGGVNNGIVEYSVMEYVTTAKDDYTNGVDVHTGANWIIRHNLFRNIVSPAGQKLAGPAVLMWNHSRDTLTEGNTFLNCARGISYGLLERTGGSDHVGGVIRNNFFYRSSNQPGDVGIEVADSPDTLVLNNTVFVSGTYPYADRVPLPRHGGRRVDE